MKSFKAWVLVLAVFFGMSLTSGTKAMAEETATAPAVAATTTPVDKMDQTDKSMKKHHKKKSVGVKKHHKKKANADATAADSTVKS